MATRHSKQVTACCWRLIRLGGWYERASLARDFATCVALEEEMENLGKFMGEDFAYWLLFIRGRNRIRVCRGLEQLSV